MTIVCCQLDTAWEDKATNHANVRALLEANPVPPGALVVLPEMFSTGFSMNVAAVAEGDERPTEMFLSRAARETGVFLLGGVVTRGPDGRGRNEAVVFAPDGSEAARYQKMHPFTFGGEARHYAPGERPALFPWNGFTIAPFICYDLRFPEAFRSAAMRGADLFVVIANWPQAREEHWLTLLRARAIENQAYVVGVNRCGRDPALFYGGRSLVVGPRGEILADAGEEQRVVRADLDLPALRAYRAEFPALADIHPCYRNNTL